MNGNQTHKYGRIYMTLTPVSRYACCPFCHFKAQISRRGRNALASSAIVRGVVMTHMRAAHREEIGETTV